MKSKGNSSKIDHDIQTLGKFVEIYCNNKHFSKDRKKWNLPKTKFKEINELTLCKECSELLNYSINRTILCPLDPKPSCKKCRIHCYSDGYRAKIREVMKFSGIYLIKHGRFDLILHYIF
ncbi:MAG: nitrous oxide-stimulated promoter family protein [Candidatus Bathyarchaeota archaeon]|nr:nitrous oxide-stimulated promoter family protein [Candidatus Bathyarchaeota archaeon]